MSVRHKLHTRSSTGDAYGQCLRSSEEERPPVEREVGISKLLGGARATTLNLVHSQRSNSPSNESLRSSWESKANKSPVETQTQLPGGNLQAGSMPDGARGVPLDCQHGRVRHQPWQTARNSLLHSGVAQRQSNRLLIDRPQVRILLPEQCEACDSPPNPHGLVGRQTDIPSQKPSRVASARCFDGAGSVRMREEA